jgi:hypothetical protein
MTINDIKKALYKEKPTAHLQHVRKIGVSVALVYLCHLRGEDLSADLVFDVPVAELTDGLFGKEMPAQLLIRYMVPPETIEA